VPNAGKLVVLTAPGVQATAGQQVYVQSATDPAGPPTPADGDLYYNTVLNEWMSYDGARAKWLGLSQLLVQAGRNGNTGVGTFYRGIGNMVLDATTKGIACQKGTIVYLAISRTDTGLATLDVLNNGVLVATLASTVAGATATTAINVDLAAGLLSFSNAAGGATTSNVQIVLVYRRRV
jgi:hypothetical protein